MKRLTGVVLGTILSMMCLSQKLVDVTAINPNFRANSRITQEVLYENQLILGESINFTAAVESNIFTYSKVLQTLDVNHRYYITSHNTYGNSGPSETVEIETSSTQFERKLHDFIGISPGSASWGDYDNDGDLDVLLTGDLINPKTKIYQNDGNGDFSEVFAEQFVGTKRGNSVWVDVNQDGLLDIFQTGDECNGCSTDDARFYLNTGTDFQPAFEGQVPSYTQGMAAFGDLDNDGDQDLVLSGGKAGFTASEIYINNQTEFTLDTDNSLLALNFASVDLGDFDNDGDLDILLTGAPISGENATIIYVNENGIFSELNTSALQGASGAAQWFDYDMDGRLDIALTGSFVENEMSAFFAGIYRNIGGDFEEVFVGDVGHGIISPCISAGDYDNDGDLDFILGGNQSFIDQSQRKTTLYENTGSGFTASEESFVGLDNCSCTWGDADNDGDLDILISGSPNIGLFADVYQNFAITSNSLPTSPSNLTVQIDEEEVRLQWDSSSDTETSQTGLSYNVHLRNTTKDIISSNALSNGKRIISEIGNASHNTFKRIKLERGNDYFWKVQAIDNSYEGSAFSEEMMFHLNYIPEITGVKTSFSIQEDESIGITLEDLEVDDTDNTFPDDFTLTIESGDNYSIVGNEIIPDTDFNGTLSVAVSVNDGTDESEAFEISIEVAAINDIPVITGMSSELSTIAGVPIEISILHLEVSDPDNVFPNDFTLAVTPGVNYSVTANEITPNIDFEGNLSVPVTVNDGQNSSNPFNVTIQVTKPLGLDEEDLSKHFSIYPNPASDLLIIEPRSSLINYTVSIFDLGGSLVSKTSIRSGNPQKIDLRSFEGGVYQLMINSKDFIGLQRIIKLK